VQEYKNKSSFARVMTKKLCGCFFDSQCILNTLWSLLYNDVSLQDTLDAVETLLKKHEAFEKAAATQEERFVALEQITTVSAATSFLCRNFSGIFCVNYLVVSWPSVVRGD